MKKVQVVNFITAPLGSMNKDVKKGIAKLEKIRVSAVLMKSFTILGTANF